MLGRADASAVVIEQVADSFGCYADALRSVHRYNEPDSPDVRVSGNGPPCARAAGP